MFLPPQTIIASGPVIIEDGKVLLNKEQKDTGSTPWLFPGGQVEQFDISLEEACRREAKEEMGIQVEIIRPLKPMIVFRPEKPDKMAILIHFLAKRVGDITPGEGIIEWNWFDVNDLPVDCAPNVYEVIREYTQKQK